MKILVHLLCEVLFLIKADVRLKIAYTLIFQPFDIGRDDLRIISDDRTVVMVVRILFLDVPCHARIEDRLDSF